MGKTIWRELTIAYSTWLLVLIILDLLTQQFVSVIMPLHVLELVWVVNMAAWWWTKRA